MSTDNSIRFVTLTAGELIPAYRLVTFNASGNAVLCSATARAYAVSDENVASGANGRFILLQAGGEASITVTGAAARGNVVYAAASGQASTTGSGIAIGTVIHAGFAANDTARVALGAGAAPLTREVLTVTQAAALTLTPEDSGALITNLGATGAATVNLPAAAPTGTWYEFVVVVAQNLIVDPASADALIIGGAVQADGAQAAADDEGETLICRALSNGNWACTVTGTWTIT